MASLWTKVRSRPQRSQRRLHALRVCLLTCMQQRIAICWQLPSVPRTARRPQIEAPRLARVKAMRDGTLLGVGVGNNVLYVRRGALNGGGSWVEVPNSCCIRDVDELPDGRLLAVGIEPGSMFVANLTATNTLAGPWTLIAQLATGAPVVAIATPTGGLHALPPSSLPGLW